MASHAGMPSTIVQSFLTLVGIELKIYIIVEASIVERRMLDIDIPELSQDFTFCMNIWEDVYLVV